MFGFIFGGVCLALLVRTVTRHLWWRHPGYGGWRGRPGGWRRHALYSLFEQLDATPGQEKVIAGALDELRETMRRLREKFQGSRRQAAEAFRGAQLGDEETNRVFSSFDEHLDELRRAAASAMQKIHDALDDRQREILARLIERGPAFAMGAGGGCGPRRGCHAHRWHRTPAYGPDDVA